MSLATLNRIPVAQWNLLAFLQRAGGQANAVKLGQAVADATIVDLQELADQQLVTAHRGDAEVVLRSQTFLPLINIRLTPAGRVLGARIVECAGVLLLLARRAVPMQVAKLPSGQGVDWLDVLAELDEHGMVEAYVEATGVPVRLAPRLKETAGVVVRVTAFGRRYTTV